MIDSDDDNWPDKYENWTTSETIWDDIETTPISDDDKDGIPDYSDTCPSTQPGSYVNSTGCAYKDNDIDGVPDHVDLCQNTNQKQFVNSAGCVDLDNDNDGIPNSRDQCIDTKSTDYVGPDGCKIDNNSVTLVDNKCDSSKMLSLIHI